MYKHGPTEQGENTGPFTNKETRDSTHTMKKHRACQSYRNTELHTCISNAPNTYDITYEIKTYM